MGSILKTKNLTTLAEGGIVAVVVALFVGVVYFFAPGLLVGESKLLKGLSLDSATIDNVQTGAKLPLPSEAESPNNDPAKLIRVAEYAWNGNSGMIVANGGPKTTKGSLMESAGVNLEIVRQDMVGELRNMQIKFVEEFNSGIAYPKSDKSAFAVSIMGDGVPFYLSTLQKSLDEKFGKGRYHAQAIASIGLSYGEDKLIGPKVWKDNPQTMRGCVISSVVGDGDWVLAVNFASANGIPVNPDPTTYDANAINFVPSQDDDYINSVKELIKSQKNGFTVPLEVVKNGKKTGDKVNHKIDGATTWTPGDKLAFDNLSGFTDVVSTKDFPNQMATTLVVIKEWALLHEKEVINMLKQTYVATNQIKLYDEWAVRASEAVCKTYNFETPKYWYNMFKGQKGTKDGLDYNVGGTKVFNLSDAKQYYGLSDGNNRFKSVYSQVSTYLMDLNPCGFNETCPNGVVPYEDAVNLYFINSIDGSSIANGKVDKVDYSSNKTEVLANGDWRIKFNTGSAEINDFKDLESVYNLLVQAEQTKVKIVGHTDSQGNVNSNVVLSKNRAESVRQYLLSRGLSKDRFQLVDGKGSSQSVGDNSTESGRAQNRRVEITLLK
jgi:OOP family OmpA-OmpF porin